MIPQIFIKPLTGWKMRWRKLKINPKKDIRVGFSEIKFTFWSLMTRNMGSNLKVYFIFNLLHRTRYFVKTTNETICLQNTRQKFTF